MTVHVSLTSLNQVRKGARCRPHVARHEPEGCEGGLQSNAVTMMVRAHVFLLKPSAGLRRDRYYEGNSVLRREPSRLPTTALIYPRVKWSIWSCSWENIYKEQGTGLGIVRNNKQLLVEMWCKTAPWILWIEQPWDYPFLHYFHLVQN